MGRLSSGLTEIIKRVALDAVHAESPTEAVFGKVLSVNPLKIKVGDKLQLGSTFFILTKNVQDYEVEIEGDFSSGTDETPTTAESTSKTVIIKNGLKVNDKVLLLRLLGGQRYVVWDKV